MSSSPIDGGTGEHSTRTWWLVSTAAVALLAFLGYRQFLDLALLGLDTFPMILSGRILSFQDFVGTFTEELMDGMYPDGHFYRPVANLAFALDYALWRMTPLGYHITDLVILIANATLLSALVRKLFGPRALVGAFLAGMLFVLHPIQLELVPAPPRRADALCAGFLLACLLAQPDPDRPLRQTRWRTTLSALFALLAVGSKETGAIALPMVFALQFLRAGGPSLKARLAAASRHSVAPFLALGVFMLARNAVLSGLGGHAGSSLAGLGNMRELIVTYASRVLYPQYIFGSDLDRGRIFVAVLSIAIFLGTVAIWRWPATSVVRERTQVRTGFLFLGAWSICLLCISSLAGRVHDWYVMLFVAPYAVGLGMLVDRSIALIRSSRPLPAILPLAAALLAIGSHVAYSPLCRDYDGWSKAGQVADAQIVRFENVLAKGQPGKRALLDRFVPWIPPEAFGSGIQSAYLHADHSLQAYAQLVHPEQAVHVDFHTGGPLPPPPSPDVFQV
ncbi:MAG: hypothetical protein ACI80N_004008, partial [Gammaproteobacteria bacterium]